MSMRKRTITTRVARSLYDGSIIHGKQRGEYWVVPGNRYTGEGADLYRIGEEVEVLLHRREKIIRETFTLDEGQ